MVAFINVSEIDDKECISVGLSIHKRSDYEIRHMILVCTKDGKIKETYKEVENENDDTCEYDGYAYVEYDKDDKYINCKMELTITDGEVKPDYAGAMLYSFGNREEGTDNIRLIVDDYNKCIIINNVKNEFSDDEDYNTFEFDNINSYERFGIYAEAVMTAMQRMINYK